MLNEPASANNCEMHIHYKTSRKDVTSVLKADLFIQIPNISERSQRLQSQLSRFKTVGWKIFILAGVKAAVG